MEREELKENGKERGEYEFAEEKQIRSLIFFRAKHHRNHLQFKITTCKVKTDKFSLVCYYWHEITRHNKNAER